jgi:hypothetical protein
MAILLPMGDRHWRTPSQAQPKNIFGHENQTRFSATARFHDGYIVWRGWFDDRNDFDAFIRGIVTGLIHYERPLWRLPTPWWHPDIDAPLGYEFLTTQFITSGATWPVPPDCVGVNNLSGEFIDTIAAGGSGGMNSSTGSGGSGGAWSRITTLALTPSGTINIGVGTGGAGYTGASAGRNGNAGTDTWFNGSTLVAASVGAKAGGAGLSTGAAVAGGLASGRPNSGNTTGFNGGGSGAVTTSGATGGGGAAGLNGAGVSSAGTSGGVATAGGNGDNGSGGAGSGAGSTSPGGTGTEYDGTSHGSGGGSGATVAISAHVGAGGNYGAGSGGTDDPANTSVIGAGAPGLIVVRYTPFIPISVLVPEFPFVARRYRVVNYG